MKHLFTTLFIISITILLKLQSQAQCHIDDWTALKALYESTNGGNWIDRTGWDTLIDGHSSPPTNCDLSVLYGIHLNLSDRIECIDLDGKENCNPDTDGSFLGNGLTGSLPYEISFLVDLKKLYLTNNRISGDIPAQIGNLYNLTYLGFSNNEFEGEIPSSIGNLENLFWLHLNSNNFIGQIPSEIGNLINLKHLTLGFNNLTGEIPPEISNLTNLLRLDLGYNYSLSGYIPEEFGNLQKLEHLGLIHNKLSGNIPPELSDLPYLETLYLNSNKLSGEVPDFSFTSLEDLSINENYFSCQDILENYTNNQNIQNFTFNYQYFGESYSIIFDSTSNNIVNIQFTTIPSQGSTTDYIWRKNSWTPFSEELPNNSPFLTLTQINPTDAGAYRLWIEDNCLPNMTFQSEPIYLIYKGYDLFGQPVEYNEIMVEFDSPTTTQFYENELLFPNAGFVVDSCNCNRELYLWKFNNAEDAMAALLEIDLKKQTIKGQDSDIDGGFNNYINVGSTDNGGTAYDVLCNMSGSYPDDVSIYLLDTGLDETGITNTPYLIQDAPVDNCYVVDPAPGYNYNTTPLNNDYMDEQGHGTYGFRSITDELSQQPNSIDVVPLKIFDENGEGNLFDLTCAVYHAIDHGADVINISAGYRGQPSSILEKAINIARENGVFICTAAGNDALDIDITPQYPAYFASQYHYIYDEFGEVDDSIRYDNVISVTAIDEQNNLVDFSNYGQQAVTLSAYGKNIHSYGLGSSDEIWSGTSMATYFVSRELALEIARNKNRDYQQIWSAFESNSLTFNASTIGKTRTNKRLNVSLDEAVITPPCQCNCNQKVNIDLLAINAKFGKFANDEFVNNYLSAEKAYIKNNSEIHHILETKDIRYKEVQEDFGKVKDITLALLFQSFAGKGNTTITNEHIQLIDAFLVSLSKATESLNLVADIENVRKYLNILEGKEVKAALIAFDKAGLTNDNEDMFDMDSQVKEGFSVQLVNAVGQEAAYLTYQSGTSGTVHVNLFDVEGRTVGQSSQQSINKGNYQYPLFKQALANGIYYVQVNFKSDNGEMVNEILKLSIVQ